MLVALGLAACVAPVDPPVAPVTIADLWADAVPTGGVTLGPVVLTSPVTATGAAFYAQDPGGGPATSLRIDVAGFGASLLPPAGTEVTLAGAWTRDANGAPTLWIDDPSDVTETGASTPTIDAWDAVGPWDHALVALDLTVTSAPDPSRAALTDRELWLDGRFGADTPGWQSAGTAVGLVVEPGWLALRDDADWSGTRVDAAPLAVALDQLGALADGTPVTVEATQAAPWGPDGRWTALQDAGAGVWVDAEGWAVAGSPEGQRARWTGEVRADGEGLRLRVWTPPAPLGDGVVETGVALVDGARVQATVRGPGPADAWGERPTDGPTLDDRLGPIDALVDGDVITAIVRETPDGLRLAPLP